MRLVHFTGYLHLADPSIAIFAIVLIGRHALDHRVVAKMPRPPGRYSTGC